MYIIFMKVLLNNKQKVVIKTPKIIFGKVPPPKKNTEICKTMK